MLIKSDKKRTNNLLHSKGKAHYLTKRQKGGATQCRPALLTWLANDCHCMRRSPSQRTFHVPSEGNPGLRTVLQPSQPAHIIATALSRLPLPGK